ncbi:hypothetical protein OEZ85_012765 [Tetradesmus obliquus]|uniref:Uncharacterized protein n=1 Tax=Tetradesmus obliquus TaxID=3088 RepID=A0ABY8U3K4_TETOB|nr:hypothetical protein OEZ85_012765 [Tetradesmus obliquus]
MKSISSTCASRGRLVPAARSLGRLKVLRVSNAFKRPVVQPPVVTPEEKTLQSVVETGIRGSIAMAAAYALHLNLSAWLAARFTEAGVVTCSLCINES